MHGNQSKVLGNAAILTESLYRSFASDAVRRVQLHKELTDQDVADLTGACAATIGNARNKDNSLSGKTLLNLLAIDEMALEGLLHHFGRRSVPISARCDTDALIPTSAAVHKLAVAQSPASTGGAKLTDCECLEIEPDINAAIEALSAIQQRCHAIRKGRAA